VLHTGGEIDALDPLVFVKTRAIDTLLNACYTDSMMRILLLQLSPTPQQHRVLVETMHTFNAAANYVAAVAFAEKTANKVVLQQVVYGDLRTRFRLPAQLAIRAISAACEAYKRDRNKAPSFPPEGSVTYDGRVMSFKGLMAVSLLTLAGRMHVHFQVSGYRQAQVDSIPGWAELLYNGRAFTLEVASEEAGAAFLQEERMPGRIEGNVTNSAASG
jgi:predicted transposase